MNQVQVMCHCGAYNIIKTVNDVVQYPEEDGCYHGLNYCYRLVMTEQQIIPAISAE